MKKILCSMFLAALTIFGATTCLAEEQDAYLIYVNNDFEDHSVGEDPNAFAWHYYDGYGFYSQEEDRITAIDNTEIVTLAKDGNSSNKAIKFNADVNDEKYNFSVREYQSSARAIFTYYPIKENGVISFSFMVEDATKAKSVNMGRNAISSRHITYVDNKDPGNGDSRYVQSESSSRNSSWGKIFKVADGKAYYTGNGTDVELGDVANNTWYDIDFIVDIPAGTGTVYYNGTSTEVSLPENTVNIYEIRFYLPTDAGDVWYIDDLRIYEADQVLEDSVLDAQWERYTDSSFYTGYEFEASRAANYDYMAFLKCDGKRFLVINTDRVFDGSHVIHLPAKVYYKGNDLMVPVSGMAELLGATSVTNTGAGDVVVDFGDKTLTFVPESDTYYVNDKPAKLRIPAEIVDGAVCIQIDVLFGLLGEDYTLQEDILWIDQPNEFDWHMPLALSGTELSGTSNLSLQDNIYKRILHMILYDRPTDTQIADAMLSSHPRIEFTAGSLATIKANLATDSKLKAFVDARIAAADTQIAKAQQTDDEGNLLYYANGEPMYVDDVVYGTGDDGKRISFGAVGDYVDALAGGYLLSDDTDKKAQYKARILHHFNYLKDPTLFKDWGIYYNSGLGTGSMAYGFARAIDWVDWEENEIAMIEEACQRNILDHALHSYTCTLNQFHHAFSYSEGNQALITNGGILLLATALYERDPEYYSDIIRGALRATEGGTISYFPNGEYIEGISYWRYASGPLAQVLKGLQTSMGTDWGITDVPGVLKTGYFPFMMKGATEANAYAFGDGQAEKADSQLMMFVASQTGDKALAQFRKTHQQSAGKTISDIANWVFDTESDTSPIYADDVYNVENSTVIMKTGVALTDTSVAFHGGANDDGHGHRDIGSFQFDMNGVRFAIDLDREDYNLRDKGHTDINKVEENYPTALYPNGYPYTGAHYYRIKGEGHNTVVANRSVINAKKLRDENGVFVNYDMTGTYDMNGSAKSEFIDMKFGEDESFAVLNMTETNDILSCAIRGVKLDKANNILYVQDDFTAKSETDFLWSMHTGVSTFSLSNDGKSVTLTSGSKKIKATIINDNGCDLKFEILPAEFDTTYGSDVKPVVETANTGKFKLAVRTPEGKNISRFKLTVAFQPDGSTAVPVYAPLETWK